ncbi:hypothetical protein [Cobetia sp. AM6]|uniref:hypothetical protein n=1 Tax=Cobetia sp. AM6 TaxID=2661553 RepID=UPI001298F17B|nr:hypothetical protein [Cobetia sp. AM6]BBO55822.1 hypothetical protein CLAM6_11330 [Cobetia sp. AM6]
MSYRPDLEYRGGRIAQKTDAHARKPLPEFTIPERINGAFLDTIARESGMADDTTLKGTRDTLASWRQSFEQLSKVRNAQDPAVTQAAHLNQLAKLTDAALTRMSGQFDRARAGLNLKREALQGEAIERLGLTTRGQAAEAEIRSALLSMSAEARQKAISEAIQRGDGEVIYALTNASPLVSGISAENQGTIMRRALLAHAPDVLRKQEAIDKAQSRLNDGYTAALDAADVVSAKAVADSYRRESQSAAAARAELEGQA